MDNFIDSKGKFIKNKDNDIVASKGGWSGSAIHDVGIVFDENPYIVVGLSNLGNTNEYNSYFSSDSEFSNKKEYYASLAPVNLSEMETFSQNRWDTPVGFAKDHLGNEFNNCFVFSISRSELINASSAEYYVNDKYVSITGTLAASDEQAVDEIGRVDIYADDELVYTSQNITAKTDPFDFNVDITGKKYIVIKVWALENENSFGNSVNVDVILADVKLNKY